jgi:DNA segregation ATPase FtsK/SpoIIIE, S-DNA-T family
LRALLSSHVEDVWGIALVTAGLLTALALYFGGLGPAGHAVRHGIGGLVGVGRLLVPVGFVAAGASLVSGRPSQQDPTRAVVGLFLALLSVSGLADLAGGHPHLTASWVRLDGAGGWMGAAVGGPLRAGLGQWGAAVVLVAVMALAAVVFTGVTLKQAGAGLAKAAQAAGTILFRPEDEEDEELEGDADVVDAPAMEFFEDVAPAQAPAPRAVAEVPDVAPDPPEPVAIEPASSDAPTPDLVENEPEFRPAAAVAAAVEPMGVDLGAHSGQWRLPPMKILSRSKPQQLVAGEVESAGRALVAALVAHGVDTRLVGHTVGPTVTRFELELGPGVKVARITSLAKDIAYAMASPDVRILAPIPGKSAIGVEVPNRRRQLVTLGDVLSSEEAGHATQALEVGLGRDIAGRAVMVNLAEMPHILISGATGAGKSSCINSLLTSIVMRATPEQVRLILVDPKRVELGQYNGLPHLLTQVVVDPKKAANALSWAVTEMERRYDLLAEAGMRDITGYNDAIDSGELGGTAHLELDQDEVTEDDVTEEDALENGVVGQEAGHVGPYSDPVSDGGDGYSDYDDTGAGEDIEAEILERSRAGRVAERMAESRQAVEGSVHYDRLPFVLIVVDELNDLMMVAARDVEESVCRIAQMARAVGIHLVLATQRPSVDVITGVIKANVPSRLAFSVSSLADSRVILDQPGAERLVGKGDMLLLTASSSIPRRIQGPWVGEDEVRAAVAHWRRQSQPQYVEGIGGVEGAAGAAGVGDDDDDELLTVAMELVVRSQLGSTSMLQRKLRVGFSRAGRLMDLLERRGVVGPSEGSKARAVLMTPEELDQLPAR